MDSNGFEMFLLSCNFMKLQYVAAAIETASLNNPKPESIYSPQ
jgi:hypothetical protein